MNRYLVLVAGAGLSLAASGGHVPTAFGQAPALAPADAPALPEPAASPVRPLTEGPLHEAFLSPARDREPLHVGKVPPAPIVERPGVEAPDSRAQWIDGYWEWDTARNDFTWVTGTWRVPPPGKFWVNGYWKRDDQGWYRAAGFWSDRKTDRIDFRKNGPPVEHPDDEPGESPGDDYFYVPGQYFPDGDGVVWKPGFWAMKQEGWSWVPAQWVRQPEGWAFQDGYWDRMLEDRGLLFAPAEVDESARAGDDLVYQPYTQISPQSYGLLYGAFGRPDSAYDGYPGCYYDPSGRYYGYAQYGSIGSYYGYLDYPYYGAVGYPYLTSPVNYGVGVGGFGFGGLGVGGFGFGGLGCGLFGNAVGGVFGFGSPFCGVNSVFVSPGFGFGFGSPFLGFGGFGSPFFGFGGFGRSRVCRYPFYPGGHRTNFRGNLNPVFQQNNRVVNLNRTTNVFVNNNAGAARALLARNTNGVRPPPSSRPYANPFHNLGPGQTVNPGRAAGAAARAGATGATARAGALAATKGSARTTAGPIGNGWNTAYNGGKASTIRHTTARPTFTANVPGSGRPGAVNPIRGGRNGGGGSVGGLPGGSKPVTGLHPGAGPLGGSKPVAGVRPGAGPLGGSPGGSKPVAGLHPGAGPLGGSKPVAGGQHTGPTTALGNLGGGGGPATIHRGGGRVGTGPVAGLGPGNAGLGGAGLGGGVRHGPTLPLSTGPAINHPAGPLGNAGRPGGLGGAGVSAPTRSLGGSSLGIPRGGLGGGISGAPTVRPGGGGSSVGIPRGGFGGGGVPSMPRVPSGGGVSGGVPSMPRGLGGSGVSSMPRGPSGGGFSGGGARMGGMPSGGGFSGGGGRMGGMPSGGGFSGGGARMGGMPSGGGFSGGGGARMGGGGGGGFSGGGGARMGGGGGGGFSGGAGGGRR